MGQMYQSSVKLKLEFPICSFLRMKQDVEAHCQRVAIDWVDEGRNTFREVHHTCP